jgi:hypothetical protein
LKKGSLYGHAVKEVSPKMAEKRAEPWIFSGSRMFLEFGQNESYRLYE